MLVGKEVFRFLPPPHESPHRSLSAGGRVGPECRQAKLRGAGQGPMGGGPAALRPAIQVMVGVWALSDKGQLEPRANTDEEWGPDPRAEPWGESARLTRSETDGS